MVLQELHWELSSIIALDYLDHLLPRLQLPAFIDLEKLRKKTETIICLAATHNQFCNQLPSSIAAASIYTALASCNSRQADSKLDSILSITKESCKTSESYLTPKTLRETRLCLQILTHVGSDTLEQICKELNDCLPHYLTGGGSAILPITAVSADSVPNSPDTTTDLDLDIFTDLSKAVNISSPNSEDFHNSILVT